MRKLVNELSKLPSVGEKSAIRLAYHLITGDQTTAFELANAIKSASEKIGFCKYCYALSESEICSICLDPSRVRDLLCVVEKPADLLALERSGTFDGIYHVLHGLWSPMRGVDTEQTKIDQLIIRVKEATDSVDSLFPKVRELVLATSTTVEGDATALFIADAVKDYEINVTRIAQGLPKGGELEYADELTLAHALGGRHGL